MLCQKLRIFCLSFSMLELVNSLNSKFSLKLIFQKWSTSLMELAMPLAYKVKTSNFKLSFSRVKLSALNNLNLVDPGSFLSPDFLIIFFIKKRRSHTRCHTEFILVDSVLCFPRQVHHTDTHIYIYIYTHSFYIYLFLDQRIYYLVCVENQKTSAGNHKV